MENWVNFLLLSNESEGFGINSDILETNLINIVLLIALLVSTVGKFLSTSLDSRQEQIINNVQDAEKRLNEANERLNEAKVQWAQTQIVFDEIKSQNKQTKANLLKADFTNANKDLALRFKTGLMVAKFREKQVFNDIIIQVTQSTLEKTISKIQSQLGQKEQSLIIDTKINRLEGGQL
jgi:F-type H+-transporting ATPase subunit b